MNDLTDSQLLRAYAERRSEPAFAELVRRHLDFVYSTAARIVRDPHLAKDVTQGVFVALAGSSAQLSERASLAGWLHCTTRNIAAHTVRTIERQRAREQEAITMHTQIDEDTSAVWEEVSPQLDEALSELNETDREAVLLRYFQNRDFRKVGLALGVSDDTAQKRVSRAVERLREIFARRGVAVGAGSLALMLSTNSVQAAPAGLLQSISLIAAAKTALFGGPGIGLAKGFLKTTFAPIFGMFAAFLGSAFFMLKSEVASARSPRERQFLVRMIWLRFGLALVGTAVPVALVLTVPEFLKRPGVVEFGMAGYCFFGALEAAVRMTYFHRRRRQIQIEDGTWSEWEPVTRGRPAQLLADLRGQSSEANAHAAMASVLGLVSCLIATPVMMVRMLNGGHTISALLFLALGLHGCWWCLRRWRLPTRFVFDPRLSTLVKFVLFFGAATLFIVDLSWVRGRLPLTTNWAVVFNVVVVLAYAALIGIVARWHRTMAGSRLPTNPSTP